MNDHLSAPFCKNFVLADMATKPKTSGFCFQFYCTTRSSSPLSCGQFDTSTDLIGCLVHEIFNFEGEGVFAVLSIFLFTRCAAHQNFRIDILVPRKIIAEITPPLNLRQPYLMIKTSYESVLKFYICRKIMNFLKLCPFKPENENPIF